MTIRTQLKAGKLSANHNETLQRASERRNAKSENATNIVWMRRQPMSRSRNGDRLTLLVVRAGLRAGRRGVRWCPRH
jgi:hypothetical protein